MAKKLKLWQTIFLILVLVIFSLFFSLAFLLFSKSPDFTKPQLQMADNLVGMRYVWQIVGSAQKAENSDQWVSLQIAQTDVMKLVRLGANGADFLAIAGIKIKNFDSKYFENLKNPLSELFFLQANVSMPLAWRFFLFMALFL